MTDPRLLDLLAETWAREDPPPAGLAERVLVTLATSGLEEEHEHLQLVGRDEVLTGARASPVAPTTLSLEAAGLSVLLHVTEVDARRRSVVGWIEPAQPAVVRARQGGGAVEAEVDETGRFSLPLLAAEDTRIVVVTTALGADGRPRGFASHAVTL